MCRRQTNIAKWEQDKHQLKLRKPLSEVVDFEIADWMFSCEFPPAYAQQPVADGPAESCSDCTPGSFHTECLQSDGLCNICRRLRPLLGHHQAVRHSC